MVDNPDQGCRRGIGPILKTNALPPARSAHARTRRDAHEEQGYLRCGPSGAGHYVKMVHNSIEYGMMAALAERLNILENADAGIRESEHCARSPRSRSGDLRLTIDTQRSLSSGVAARSPWSAARSDGRGARGQPHAERPRGTRLGFGRRALDDKAAVDTGVPVQVLAASLFERFASRGEGHYANQLLSAMRLGSGATRKLPPETCWRQATARPTPTRRSARSASQARDGCRGPQLRVSASLVSDVVRVIDWPAAMCVPVPPRGCAGVPPSPGSTFAGSTAIA